MCLIAFALECHPRYRLVLAANRDEYRRRPTEPARFWDDAPQLLAGRDLQAGGTWLGISRQGKLAAVTNYRDMRQQPVHGPSRGQLVAGYLQDPAMAPEKLAAYLQGHGQECDGFNLLYGSIGQLHYFTNRGGSSGPVAPGIHALSNHLLDSRWPKAVTVKERLAALLHEPEADEESLFRLMADPTPFADHTLPDTGIGPDLERFLSPVFIEGEVYGTRSTTVIMVDRQGEVLFAEQGHDIPGLPRRRFRFRLDEGGGA